MKRPPFLLTALVSLALSSASLHAALYWDSNGSTPGSIGVTPGAPGGLWGNGGPGSFADAWWSPDPNGLMATGAWVAGETAVFSASTDATMAFDVFVETGYSPSVGGIIFEEGQVALSGEAVTMTNEFDFPIICYTNATTETNGIINSDLIGTCGVRKTGLGRLLLGGDLNNAYSGTNTVVEGVLGITTPYALGLYGAASPTIVSNGAALEQTAAMPNDNTAGAYLETIVLNGMGITNGGAFECRAVGGNKGGANGATIILDSDARINTYASTAWWQVGVITTNGVNNANLYIGGNGAAVRFMGGRAMYLTDQVVYKDGACTMQFETPGYAKELRWIEGHITTRYGSGTLFLYSGGAATPIYAGVRAGQYRNGNGGPNTTASNPFILDAGANVVFRPYGAYSITLNGEISGQGGISHYNDTGTLNLNAANTYSGNTVLLGGTTTLGASGSISNSAVIDVQSGATFNVSAVTGGFVLQSAQTLKGNGTINGSVTADGTLSPGASIGHLTFNNDLTIAGNLSIEVDRAGFPANDDVAVLGVLTNAGTGTLTVVNNGAALAPGDSFTIFSQAVLNGQAITVTGGGATWTNELASSGKITVVSVVATQVPATNLTIAATGPASFQLGGQGGANLAYSIYASTNVTTPMTNWWLIGTTNANASGVIQFTDTQATNSQRFYRFGQ